MRPIRLALSMAASFLALTIILYITFRADEQTESRVSATPASKSSFKALFSFASPGSLFPPSAIISLTDDNSTFFLARPAAFGPLLPEKGLSGPLWVGGGFGEDAMRRGELGCSDVPGWSEEDVSAARPRAGVTTSPHVDGQHATDAHETDDHLVPSGESSRSKISEHADIQSLQEGAEIAGQVVLLKRGGCGFLDKVKWAQRRGGTAVVVGDNVRGGTLIRMYAHGDTSNISIPAVFTSHTTAQLLSSLVPSGDITRILSSEDVAKLKLNQSREKNNLAKSKSEDQETQESDRLSTSTHMASGQANPSKSSITSAEEAEAGGPRDVGLLGSLVQLLGLVNHKSSDAREVRPNVDSHDQSFVSSRASLTSSSVATPGSGDFIIGKHDWRDPDLLPVSTIASSRVEKPHQPKADSNGRKQGIVVSGSRDYILEEEVYKKSNGNGWFDAWFSGEEGKSSITTADLPRGSGPPPTSTLDAYGAGDEIHKETEPHDGLWVTLAPTTMSSSPFFDTLLVLVVSPLVTLTVVYALLLLRSRIRRRRWRAPKSVVDRLPVRTYHTISDSNSSPSATPATTNPTTPLLQHERSRPASSDSRQSRPRSRPTSDVPATSSSFQPNASTTEEEKREAGLAEWRRRYGGRQKECVVCLEEYIDGVSRVMSLPCGHEFHAECITPWLVTRRRTCPICKGDVVRDLSRNYRRDRNNHNHPASPTHQRRFSIQNAEDLQAQAAESRNDAPSSSRPVNIGGHYDEDIEANWADPLHSVNSEGRRSDIHQDFIDLSSSVRELSQSVRTVIWRGLDAVRDAVGLQRRPSHDFPGEVDRDR